MIARRVVMLAALTLLLSAVPLISAYPAGNLTVTPFEYLDTGNASLPKFGDMDIRIDCNAARLYVLVESNDQPVQGAAAFLKVTKYEQPLIGSGTTDSRGAVAFHIPGNISFMTGFFVLTVEKQGYQKREAHFDINDCFVVPPPSQPGPSASAPVQPIPPENQPNGPVIGSGSGSQAGSSGNATTSPTANQSAQAGNSTGANQNDQNQTGQQNGSKGALACLPGFALLALAGLTLVFIRG